MPNTKNTKNLLEYSLKHPIRKREREKERKQTIREKERESRKEERGHWHCYIILCDHVNHACPWISHYKINSSTCA